MPKLVCIKTIGGVAAPRILTTVSGPQGAIIKQIVGVGNPYWIWNDLPGGQLAAVDFTDAPIASSDVSVNNANAAPLLATPSSVDWTTVLTYA